MEARSGTLPILRFDDVSMRFPLARKRLFGGAPDEVHAVKRVSLSLAEGTTLGLVGESGSGKTTVGRIVAHLLEPTGGRIYFDARDVTRLRGAELRAHLPNVQMVFQDPYNSLSPHLSLAGIIEEPLKINRRGTRIERRARAAELLEAVGMSRADMGRMPSDLSGGQRQRVAICRALALNPRLVVCDEAVSALDVSTQAKIINLLVDLQQRYGLTYLFISHDLGIVRLVADVVAVMYLGRIVEVGPSKALLEDPRHPYTRALLDAVPDSTRRKQISVIEGEIPSNIDPPAGCAFYSRCPRRMDVCHRSPPAMVAVEEDRRVACFLYGPDAGEASGSRNPEQQLGGTS